MISINRFGKSELVPWQITAQSRLAPTYDAEVSRGKRMDGQQRLLLCVVLQAIAEQDIRFVDAKPKQRVKLANEAIDFVQSAEFQDMCAQVGLGANWLRRFMPEQAFAALKVLRDPRANLDAAADALLEMRTQILPAGRTEGERASMLEMRRLNQIHTQRAIAA